MALMIVQPNAVEGLMSKKRSYCGSRPMFQPYRRLPLPRRSSPDLKPLHLLEKFLFDDLNSNGSIMIGAGRKRMLNNHCGKHGKCCQEKLPKNLPQADDKETSCSDQNSTNPTEQACKPETRDKWTKTVQLPKGFDISDIEDIIIFKDKVVLSLNESHNFSWGFERPSLFLPVAVPRNLVHESLKVRILGNDKVKPCATKNASPDKKHSEDKSATCSQAESETNNPITGFAEPIMERLTRVDGDELASGPECCASNPKNCEQNASSSPTEDNQTCCSADEEGESCNSDELDLSTTDIIVVSKEEQNSTAMEAGDTKAKNSVCDFKESEESEDDAKKSENPLSVKSQEDKEFKVQFDLSAFLPEDISIRLSDHALHVDAVHHEDTVDGTIHQELHRTVLLPACVDEKALRSRLGEDGGLIISAPHLTGVPHERVLRIEHH